MAGASSEYQVVIKARVRDPADRDVCFLSTQDLLLFSRCNALSHSRAHRMFLRFRVWCFCSRQHMARTEYVPRWFAADRRNHFGATAHTSGLRIRGHDGILRPLADTQRIR